MKFILDDATNLWEAISRVRKATPRKTMGAELEAICLESEDDNLLVHRFSNEAYAHAKVAGASIIESGKVLVADGTIARSMRGRTRFELVGNDLIGTELAYPDNTTTFRLSSTDPFLYTRLFPPKDTIKLNIDLGREVLWMAKDAKLLYDRVILDGDKIFASENINITCLLNGETILDGYAIVPADFFLAYGDNSRIATIGNKVWSVEGDDFAYSNVTLQVPYQPGSYWRVIESYLALPKKVIRVKVADLTRVLTDVFEVSEDRIYRHGLCQLQAQDGLLTIRSTGRDSGGDIQRVIEAETVEAGDFLINNYPKRMLDAIRTIEDEAEIVTLSACWSELHQNYALILHTDKVYNFIPCSPG